MRSFEIPESDFNVVTQEINYEIVVVKLIPDGRYYNQKLENGKYTTEEGIVGQHLDLNSLIPISGQVFPSADFDLVIKSQEEICVLNKLALNSGALICQDTKGVRITVVHQGGNFTFYRDGNI
jgi:hypothetical protein